MQNKISNDWSRSFNWEVLSQAGKLVRGENHRFVFFFVVGIVIGLIGWGSEIWDSSYLKKIHDSLMNPEAIGFFTAVLSVAVIYSLVCALFGHYLATHRARVLTILWGGAVAIFATFFGYSVIAFVANFTNLNDYWILPVKAIVVLLFYELVILATISILMVMFKYTTDKMSILEILRTKRIFLGFVLMPVAITIVVLLDYSFA